jgi:hypothetical protein
MFALDLVREHPSVASVVHDILYRHFFTQSATFWSTYWTPQRYLFRLRCVLITAVIAAGLADFRRAHAEPTLDEAIGSVLSFYGSGDDIAFPGIVSREIFGTYETLSVIPPSRIANSVLESCKRFVEISEIGGVIRSCLRAGLFSKKDFCTVATWSDGLASYAGLIAGEMMMSQGDASVVAATANNMLNLLRSVNETQRLGASMAPRFLRQAIAAVVQSGPGTQKLRKCQ